MERVVNIIGMGKTCYTVPDTGENWGINVAYKFVKKMDKVFFFDDFAEIDKDDKIYPPKDYGIVDMVKANPGVEIISRYDAPLQNTKGEILAQIKAFPINDALSLAPGCYFTSTVAYLITYAILEKVDRIRLYGIEMWSGSDANEYVYQRPCVEFWLAFALGRGIKVEMPYYLLHTVTANQNLYGYAPFDLKRQGIK